MELGSWPPLSRARDKSGQAHWCGVCPPGALELGCLCSLDGRKMGAVSGHSSWVLAQRPVRAVCQVASRGARGKRARVGGPGPGETLWSLCPVRFSLLDSNCIATNSAIIEVLHRSFRFSGSWHFNKPEAFGQTTCLINGDSAELHRAKLLKQLAQLFLCGRTIQITYQQLHAFTRSRRLIAEKNRTPQRPQLGRPELRTRCPGRRAPSRSRTLAADVPDSVLVLSPQPFLRIELGKPFSMDRDRAVAIA